MRTLFWASLVGSALTWLAADVLANIPTESPAQRPLSAVYKGELACPVGLVEVASELLPRVRSRTGPQPAIATAWVSVNGAAYSHTAAANIRVDGAEFRPMLPAKAGEVEVFVGLGQDCDWIPAGRVR